MRTRATLRKYQVRAALKMVESTARARIKETQARGIGLFVDMALGKTSIALTAFQNMKTLGIVPNGAMVIAPIDVTKDTWQNEAKLWSHLKDLTFQLVDAKNRNERIRQLESKADIKIISYTLLPWLGKLLAPKLWRPRRRQGKLIRRRPSYMPSLLILDESEYIKGRGTWFRMIKRTLKYIPFRVLLTGTPASHSLHDLWAQIYVLDKGARLCSAHERFQSRFFEKEHPRSYNYVPRPGAKRKIYGLINDILVRLDAEDHLKLPKIIPNIIKIKLPPRAMALYRKHEEEMYTQLDNDKEVEAANMAILTGQCWQIAGGAIYDDLEERDSWTEIHTAKMDRLKALLEELGEEQRIIAYWFRHERERLAAAYPKATFLTKHNVMQVKEDWNKGKIRDLFMNPGRSAHGLNMQFGGHHVIFYTQIWSGGKHDQLIARLRRPDQKSKYIIATYLTAEDTVDEVISYSRTHRLTEQKELLDALRTHRRR